MADRDVEVEASISFELLCLTRGRQEQGKGQTEESPAAHNQAEPAVYDHYREADADRAEPLDEQVVIATATH